MNPCLRSPLLECGSDFLEILLKGKEGRGRGETQWEDPRWLLSSSLRPWEEPTEAVLRQRKQDTQPWVWCS